LRDGNNFSPALNVLGKCGEKELGEGTENKAKKRGGDGERKRKTVLKNSVGGGGGGHDPCSSHASHIGRKRKN